MKTFNQFMAFAFSFSVICFASCESDEPSTPGGDGGGTTLPADTSKRVSSFTAGNGADMLSTFDFDSQSRMVSGKHWGDPFTVSFSPFEIVLKSANNESDVSVFKDIKSNEQGYITFMKVGDVVGEYTIEFSYDNDGYMSSCLMKEGENVFSSSSFEWENGNLVKADYQDELTDEFTYTADAPENSGVYLHDLCKIVELDFLFYGGYLGKATANIPTSVTTTRNGSKVRTKNISVTSDEKGRVIEYKEDGNLKYVYAYDGKEAVWSGD